MEASHSKAARGKVKNHDNSKPKEKKKKWNRRFETPASLSLATWA